MINDRPKLVGRTTTNDPDGSPGHDNIFRCCWPRIILYSRAAEPTKAPAEALYYQESNSGCSNNAVTSPEEENYSKDNNNGVPINGIMCPSCAAAALAMLQKQHPISNNGDRTSTCNLYNIQSSKDETYSLSPPLPPPRVTAASAPFEKMIGPRSLFHNELEQDPAYNHAMKAGTLWQSLCSQHVRFPALWWDGTKPAGPPLGCTRKTRWSYLGRHRVRGNAKLNSFVGNRGSSGRLLLHLIVLDAVRYGGKPIEDICVGCYHPSARGIRTTSSHNPLLENSRDVWIAHRRRWNEQVFVNDNNDSSDTKGGTSGYNKDDCNEDSCWATAIELLLRYQNRNCVDETPVSPRSWRKREITGYKNLAVAVSNSNLKAVFGSKPPVQTAFVKEDELYELLRDRLDGSAVPASFILLQRYLECRISGYLNLD